MKYLVLFLFIGYSITSLHAQVGINNTDPKSSLDISAVSQSIPTNTDGILIPRIDSFPATNPGADQNSMLVYLTTTDAGNFPGFYYWNSSISTWTLLGSDATIPGWELAGNVSTTNGTDFIGTIDNQALDVRTNNVIRARFTTTGQLELLNTGASVFLGEGAGAADDLSTNRNTFVGYESGNDSETGFNNVAIGYGAFDKSIDGGNNVAIGMAALDRTTSPENSIAIGVGALGNATGTVNNSIAIGLNALSNSTSALQNVAIGRTAGANTDGPDNVYIGYEADWLNANSGATRNVVVGSGAGEAGSGGGVAYEGRVLIGYQSGRDSRTNNTLYIENSSSSTPLIGGDFAADRLGVNTAIASLTHSLTVTGDVFASGGFETPTNTYPDYVFENYYQGTSVLKEDYEFMPLEDAIAFAKANGHLPNVKSYKEVHDEGMKINLGETSINNLEKIEENFLYIAELKEELKATKAYNRNLEQKMHLLLTRIETLEKNKD